MISLRFWRALQRPPLLHPLFRRITRQYATPGHELSRSRTARIVIASMSLGVLVGCLSTYPDLLISAIFITPLIISTSYTILHGTLAGVVYATRISSAIARERERGALDLIALSPRGGFEALWALCTGCQYYDQRFRGQGAERVWYSRVIFLCLLLLAGTIALSDNGAYSATSGATWIGLLFTLILIGFALHIDDIHSCAVASLVGLVVPMIALSRFDARLWAFLSFLTLQVIAYLAAWIGGFMLVPYLLLDLRLGGFGETLLFPFEQFLIFFASRELITRVLWRVLIALTGGDFGELRSLMLRGTS